MTTTILRLPAVKNRTGLSRSTIYVRLSEDQFPKPISLGARAIGWVESDIESWIKDRIDQSKSRSTNIKFSPLEAPNQGLLAPILP
jgi:prophage regulatory protein